MSLPESFQEAETYFEECLSYFKDYQRWYTHPNTEILVENILEEIPINNTIDISSNFDLNTIDNEFVKMFLERTELLTFHYDDVLENGAEMNIDAPLAFKKKYEIIHLAKEVKFVCEESSCGVVVDFGSGLGYLDQHLHDISGVKVLGLECNDNYCATAEKRQIKYHKNSIEKVKYVKHTIKNESYENLDKFIKENFAEVIFCITGLHACADLTVDALDIFLKMADARSIIILPCCYHKMAEINNKFINFPLSNCLKNIYSKYEKSVCFNVPFLRLAAQPTSCQDKMADLVFNMLARAVLQLYAVKHNCTVKRKKRKAVRVKTLNNDFEFYIQNAVTNGFDLIKNEPNILGNRVENANFDTKELMSTWRQLTDLTFEKAGILIKMQNKMQLIIENFILYDRIVYLLERGVRRCSFKKIFDEKLSPRCLALIAYK